MTLHDRIERFFAADGPLAERLPGYAPRAAQIDMAHAVGDALSSPRSRLVVEAGTGVGKSLAYLAPVMLSQKRALVTTATKALQDQLFHKDVPLAWGAARKILAAAELKDDVVIVKGRQNYLCKLRFESFAQQPTFAFPGDAAPWPRLLQWAHQTGTGDRAEVPGLPEPFSTWNDLDAGSEHCIGTRCVHHETCFVTQMKRRAEGARLVVSNHHLLCADVRVRMESKAAGGDSLASVLPAPDVVVLDEAHALPDIASEWFGIELSQQGHERLLVDLRRFGDGTGGDARAALLDVSLALEQALHSMWARANLALGRERQRLQPGPELMRHCQAALQAAADVDAALERLQFDVVGGAPDVVMRAAERDRLRTRAVELRSQLEVVLVQAPHDARFVVVGEAHQRGASITASPVDVARALQGTIWGMGVPIILTSATLSVAGSAHGFRERVGLNLGEAQVTERVLPSPFDHARRAALYCPKDMPAPDEASYQERYVEEARFLLEMSRGGALFLFTSHAALEQGHAALLPTAQRLGLVAHKQGDSQKNTLLDKMRGLDGEDGMVLCATHSFWEGVDIKGRALRLVVIDRLPFRVPTDPLRRARADLHKAQGGDPFLDIAVPEAALSLKQGAGRLLRGHDDAGVVAILDGRLRSRRYGALLLDTLPPMTRIGGRSALADFYLRFVQPPLGLSPARSV